MKFDAEGSDNRNWFSSSALTQSSWFDIPAHDQRHNFFSIHGAHDDKRHFFINRNYNGCPNDAGWMVITEKVSCDWEKNKKNAILYSKRPVYTNWNTNSE